MNILPKEISIFEYYRPLRNYLRKFSLVESLFSIWSYYRKFIETRGSLYKVNFFPWELEILTKELILNTDNIRGGRSLNGARDLNIAIKHIRDIDEKITQLLGSDGILKILHRTINEQIPWQRQPTIDSIVRHYFIFGDSEIDQIIERKTGLKMKKLYFLGLHVSGNFLKNRGMSINQDYSVFGIDKERRDMFFKLLTSDILSLKQDIREEQRYNEMWRYTFNPLQAKPLIRFDENYPDRVICPIPAYVTKQVSEGIFYNISKENNFDNAFGCSYQKYVGIVLKRACPPSKFEVIPENQYLVGKNRKHGVDWILKDNTGMICFECKTKRLIRKAKFIFTEEDIVCELNKMAGFIVQNYKNIEDIRSNKTNLQYNDCPIYPVILTLEEWLTFDPITVKNLDENVAFLLAKEEIDPKIMKEMPYSILSINEAEVVLQIINHLSIASYVEANMEDKNSRWPISRLSFDKYKDFSLKSLFEKEFSELTNQFLNPAFF